MSLSTQRFFLALASLIGGVVLYYFNQNEPGMLLIGASVGWLTGGGAPKKKDAAGLLILLSLSSASCTPCESYVKADRLTYDVVAPAYREYLQSDTKLTDEQRARRIRTIDAWKLRLDHAEKVSR